MRTRIVLVVPYVHRGFQHALHPMKPTAMDWNGRWRSYHGIGGGITAQECTDNFRTMCPILNIHIYFQGTLRAPKQRNEGGDTLFLHTTRRSSDH